MELNVSDWSFSIDKEATKAHTIRNSQDHCICGYCRNFYETIESSYPDLCAFLSRFGIYVHGPSEVMPFEPDYVLVCYRVHGRITQWGSLPMYVSEIMILPENGEDDTFLLWVGEMTLPWVQEEPMEDVISPANLPEFMDRMQQIWQLRHQNSLYIS